MIGGRPVRSLHRVFRERATRLAQRVRPFRGVDVAVRVNRDAFACRPLIHASSRSKGGMNAVMRSSSPGPMRTPSPIRVVQLARLRVDRVTLRRTATVSARPARRRTSDENPGARSIRMNNQDRVTSTAGPWTVDHGLPPDEPASSLHGKSLGARYDGDAENRNRRRCRVASSVPIINDVHALSIPTDRPTRYSDVAHQAMTVNIVGPLGRAQQQGRTAGTPRTLAGGASEADDAR